MRRRRFITFGSTLAMALSLGTVGYLSWLGLWHNAKQSDLSQSLISWKSDPDSVHLHDGKNLLLKISWTSRCPKCEKKHCKFCDCNGISMIQDTPSTVPPNPEYMGPIVYAVFDWGPRQEYFIFFPSWLPIPVLAAYPAVYFLVVGIWRLRRRPGHCLHCDYDLTENESGVCPECGTPVPAACVGNAIKESKIE